MTPHTSLDLFVLTASQVLQEGGTAESAITVGMNVARTARQNVGTDQATTLRRTENVFGFARSAVGDAKARALGAQTKSNVWPMRGSIVCAAHEIVSGTGIDFEQAKDIAEQLVHLG